MLKNRIHPLRRAFTRFIVGVAAFSALPLAAAETPHSQLLGRIDFPTSGAEEAQADFLQGVLFLHNFEYEQAARAFKRAQETDPDFALAYWGEAMTYNHPIWMEQDREAALEALERLAPDPAARRAKAPTERERDYLHAIEVLYGTVEPAKGRDKEERDFLYRDAMRRLQEDYAEDDEARAFHALAQLGTAHAGRDFSIYMRAAATVTPVWDENRQHPGAAHYLIHSYDDPIHAPLGLPMAKAYSKIAPDAAHAQHMTSHIFVALGLWDDVIAANEVARDVQDREMQSRGVEPRACGHYTSWLHYGYLQSGRYEEADQVMAACQESLDEKSGEGVTSYYTLMRGREIVDAVDAAAAKVWRADLDPKSWSGVRYAFATAWAALLERDGATARQQLQTVVEAAESSENDDTDELLGVLGLQAKGLLALETGDTDAAIGHLRQAAEAQAALPFAFGPPGLIVPAYELLGDVLLDKAGDAAAAVAAYRSQLERTPRRASVLLGLARAASRAQLSAEAADAYGTLAAVWHQADKAIQGLREVRDATGGGQ